MNALLGFWGCGFPGNSLKHINEDFFKGLSERTYTEDLLKPNPLQFFVTQTDNDKEQSVIAVLSLGGYPWKGKANLRWIYK